MRAPLVFLSFLLCFSLTKPLIAQQNVAGPSAPTLSNTKAAISGTVIDATTNTPLDYATVSIFAANSKALVAGTITDIDGNFSIEVKPGNYFAKVEFLAFEPQLIKDLALQGGQAINLGEINLQTAAAALEEITVTAERSTMQLSLDKKVFNVGKDLSSRGGNATDLLDNVPSIQVDVEGNISLRGSGGVRVLIDGRPSSLLGSGNAGLRSLPANLIERIEVVTNPSARYEAEGTAGIINIILKKDRRQGLNGSFDFTVGNPDNFGTAINLNRRSNKLNFFTNLGLSYRKGPGNGSLYQEVYLPNDETLISVQNSERIRSGLGGSFRFGADYFFNDNNILTTALSYRLGDDANSNTTFYRDFLNDLSSPTGSETRLDDEKEDDRRLQYSLGYKKTFPDQEGRQFTADIRYQDNTEIENSDLSNRFFGPTGLPADRSDLFQRSNNEESERSLIFQSDYIHPFGEDHRLEAGIRASNRNIDNDFLVEELNQANNEWSSLPGLSNIFNYEENILAAYLTYGNKYGRFSYQLGLRQEYSEVNTLLLETQEENKRDYLNLFPSAHINYELPGENSVQISYSRRIRRPRFWDLNPFFTFSDNRNFFSGNPNLDPEFSHSLEIGHLKYWGKGSLNTSLYYRHTDGVVQRIREVDEEGNSVTRPENLATENAYGLELTGSYEITKWWRFNADANFFRFVIDGSNVDQSFAADNFSWFTRGTSRFKVSPKTDVQLRFNYRAPIQQAQGTRKSITSVDLSAAQDLWKEKATLTLSVRDLFNSRLWRYTSEDVNFFSEGERRWRIRQVTLTLNYRMNQEKQRGNRNGGRYEGGGDDGGF